MVAERVTHQLSVSTTAGQWFVAAQFYSYLNNRSIINIIYHDHYTDLLAVVTVHYIDTGDTSEYHH